MASTLSTSRSFSSFRVRVLGPFALERDGVPVEVDRWQPRVVTLFKLLATAPSYRRSRDELVDLLWPDATPEAGAGNLRMVVHRLRHSLGGMGRDSPPQRNQPTTGLYLLRGGPSPILSEHGWVALNPAYNWELDLERLERLTSGPGDDIAALEEAAGLYRGEPLVEDRYEDWAGPIREGAQRRWSAICLRLAQLHRAGGSLEDAALWLERLLASDPLHEQALQELLSILDDLGRRTEALRRYRQFEQLLSEEMDVPPEPETLALVARLEGYLRQAAEPPTLDERDKIIPVIPRYPLTSPGPFVGREAELARTLSALPPRSGDAPGLVLLAAEAGTGKTRMLAEIAWRARGAGVLTLAGGCYEQESRLPYGPIHDALADYIHAEPEPVLRAQLEGILPEVAQVVPEVRTCLGSVEQTVASHTEDQRLALFTALCQAFERISQDTPLVLLLDDLHWADDATLQLVHFLLRPPTLDRMLIVGAYRQEEAPENASIRQLTAELERQPGPRPAYVVPLAPLSEQELGALLAGRLQEPPGGRTSGHAAPGQNRCAQSLVSSLYRLSEGNPFFAVQILRLLEEEKQLEQGDDGWQLTAGAGIELPAEVRAIVARRLRGLEPDEQEALALGAVLGREFGFPALEALWDGDERSLFAALDAAQLSHVLSETEGGYAFRHPLLREVVYDRIPRERRSRLHRQAAAALETLYGDRRNEHAAEVAWHSLHGKNRQQALRYSILAGEQAASLYAYAEAEKHYRTALQLIEEESAGSPGGERDPEATRLQAQVLEKLGALLKTVGRYAEAIELLNQSMEWYAALEDLEGERRAVAYIGRVHVARGTLDQGLAQLSAALDRLGSGNPSHGLAALHLSLAFLLFRRGRYTEHFKAAERAAELARSIGDDRLLVEAKLVRAYALPFMPRRASAGARDFQVAMEEVVRLAEEIGDSPTLTRALCALGPRHAARGELEAARRHLSRALQLAERLGDRSRIAFVSSTCGFVAFWRGEWDEAQAFFERSLAIYRELGELPDSQGSLLGIGAIAMAKGEWEAGVRHLEEHIRNAQNLGDFRWLHSVHILFAERDLLEGRPESARNRIEQLRALPGLSEDALLEVLPTLARASMEMGDVDGAERIATGAVQRARDEDARMTLAEALRTHGAALAAQRRHDEAEERFRESLSLSESMPCPYAAARTLYDYGAMLVRQGRREEGKERLGAALGVFQRLGARPYAERTEQELMKVPIP